MTAAKKKSEIKIPSRREAYSRINKHVIEHPRLHRALASIDNCRKMSQGAREPECMLILGNPGVGKTTIRDHYLSLNPRKETPDGTNVPVLAVTIPIPAKITFLASAMLAALGDDAPEKGSTEARTRRLRTLIRECKVELIFLDEFHHFIDRDNDKVLRSVADWLKNLISETRVPVILTGLPSSRAVLEANDQLRRRFSRQINMLPFPWQPHRRKDFQTFLSHLQDSLGLESSLNFADDEIAERFYYATRGYVSRVLKVARGAAFLAILRGDKELTLKHLAKAYDDRVLLRSHTSEEVVNPFHPAWTRPQKQQFKNPLTTQKKTKASAPAKTNKALKAAVDDVFRA